MKKKIIYICKVCIIQISLLNNIFTKLFKIAFILKSRSKLINFEKIHNNNFIYYNKSIKILAMKKQNTITYIIYNENFLLLNSILFKKLQL